ncbi:protein kinase family protein [Gephyromycinifex aptenodytis]|uniref:protein kinase family protein n=1 Tax=Gephyromycinifex aptenodytis TaxID=2716227 RepID=UPI001444F429|nr:protein kinase family protein [Gephyromycinifex aptenodytis]
MQGVGTGRLVAGRYALRERRATLGVIEVWAATDSTLQRDVSVTLFPMSFPRAQAVLDAARSSAVVNDPRLVRVLDVGSRGDIAWIVEESLAETTSVADLLQDGPLPPEEARRIAGEVASALEVARRNGLHHLHLTPHAVRRSNAGLIKIAGLATAAAVEGTTQPDPSEADRLDTLGVVAVLYAAMTTRWPLRGSMPGLEAAPRLAGGVAAPAEIAVAVPADLDALCRRTLNRSTGPRTTEELIRHLSPWSHTLVHHVSPRASAPATEIPRAPHRTAASSAASAGSAIAGGAVGSASPTVERRPTHREQKAHERAARAAEARREIAARRRDPGYLDLPEALEESPALAEPPAPLLAPAPLAVEGSHAKLVLGIVGGSILLALAIAIPSLTSAFDSATTEATPAARPTSRAVTSSPAAAATSSSPATSPTSAAPIAIVSARAMDPQGDNKENDGQAPRAYDGDPETAWTSEGYKAADYQTLKDSVGLAFTLPKDAAPSHISLTLAENPQDVTVSINSSRSLKDATEVASLQGVTGTQEIDIPKQAQGKGRYIIVMVSSAAEDGDRFRATISEISLS